MSWISGFFDNLFESSKGNLGDYQHAARLFTDNDHGLAPKFQHLYHIVININPNINIANANFDNNYRRTLNLLGKSASLPSFSVETETIKQYNRKKVIQTGIQYDPIEIVWHDDNSGVTNFLWQNYFAYYYNDNAHTVDGDPAKYDQAYSRIGGLNNAYSNGANLTQRFGLDKSNKDHPFFDSIQIFQLHPQGRRSTNTSYTMINPIITNWDHDRVDSEGSNLATNTMRFEYETVLYDRNFTQQEDGVNGGTPIGFGNHRYDTVPSPLQPPNAQALHNIGQLLGGVSAAGRIVTDTLEFIDDIIDFTSNLSVRDNVVGNNNFPNTGNSSSTSATQSDL